MNVFVFIAALAFLVFSFRRITVTVKHDVFHPVVFWYAFVIFFVLSRVLVLSLFPSYDYRFLSGVKNYDLIYSLLVLLLLVVVSSVSLELGCSLGKKIKVRGVALLNNISIPLIVVVLFFVVGVFFLFVYYSFLGGYAEVLSSFSESKSPAGGALFITLSYLSWVAPSYLFYKTPGCRDKTFLLAFVFFIMLILFYGVYGRATPIAWGASLCLFSYILSGKKVPVTYAIIFCLLCVLLFVSFKSFRLSLSWGRDDSTLISAISLYLSQYMYTGGEQSIIDISLSLLANGADSFPLGSFMSSFFMWPLKLVPASVLSFGNDVPTVGRQLYWWITGNSHINSGTPAIGPVITFFAGGVVFNIFVYFLWGVALMCFYKAIFLRGFFYILMYAGLAWWFVNFNRIGDLSTAFGHIVVFCFAPILFLISLSIFKKLVNP